MCGATGDGGHRRNHSLYATWHVYSARARSLVGLATTARVATTLQHTDAHIKLHVDDPEHERYRVAYLLPVAVA